MNANLYLLKEIIDSTSLKYCSEIQSLIAKLPDISDSKSIEIEQANKELYQTLLYTINQEKMDLFFNKLRLIYNDLNYKIFHQIKNDELEQITKRLKSVDKIVNHCLSKLAALLKKIHHNKSYNQIETIYIYLLVLISLKDNCDKYYSQQIEAFNNQYKNINVIFNSNINIENTLTNIEKIKALILTSN